jgi:hypothetical protein
MKPRLPFAFLLGAIVCVGFLATSSATPPDYPLRCHGAPNMARTNGQDLIVEFNKSDRPANAGLAAKQCSWDDRGFRPGEPTQIVDRRPTPGEARNIARSINGGAIWTFWVYNKGSYMRAVADFRGTPRRKPVPFD